MILTTHQRRAIAESKLKNIADFLVSDNRICTTIEIDKIEYRFYRDNDNKVHIEKFNDQ